MTDGLLAEETFGGETGTGTTGGDGAEEDLGGAGAEDFGGETGAGGGTDPLGFGTIDP